MILFQTAPIAISNRHSLMFLRCFFFLFFLPSGNMPHKFSATAKLIFTKLGTEIVIDGVIYKWFLFFLTSAPFRRGGA